MSIRNCLNRVQKRLADKKLEKYDAAQYFKKGGVGEPGNVGCLTLLPAMIRTQNEKFRCFIRSSTLGL